MDKIYTRHKLRLPIIKKNKLKNTSKKTKVAIKSTITIFIIIIVMLIIIKSIQILIGIHTTKQMQSISMVTLSIYA